MGTRGEDRKRKEGQVGRRVLSIREGRQRVLKGDIIKCNVNFDLSFGVRGLGICHISLGPEEPVE